MKIDKQKITNGLSKEDKIKISSLLDKYLIYQKTGKTAASSFLDPREIALFENRVKTNYIDYHIIEPFPECEKKLIWFGPKDEGFKEITIYYGTCSKKVKHREVLGSLFGLGLNPSTIGDIFITEEGFYLTNLTKLNSFLEENLIKVGNTKVKLEKRNEIILNRSIYQDMNILVSSMRLDVIISKLACTSRKMTQEILDHNYVLVNYQEENKGSYLLKNDDILSIRKVGKFKIGNIVASTKKNKIILEIKKYC